MKKKKLLNLVIMFIPIFILLVISLMNMYKARNVLGIYKSYALKQALWFLIGFIILGVMTIIKPKIMYKYSRYLYFVNVLFLILVLFLGKTVNGSRAWFNFGFFSFQPSELMKFSLALYLADNLARAKHNSFKDEFIFLAKIIFLTLIPSLFVFLEPDTGAIIIYLLIMLGIIFIYHINYKWYLLLILILGVFLGAFGYLYYFNKDLLIKLIGTSFFYRVDRILTFVNNDSFQLDRALMAIGTAGLFSSEAGVYIPEAPTDFIIAFTINNFGFVTFIIVMLCFLVLDIYFIVKLFRTKKVRDKMFISAFLMMFIFAQIENIGMNLGILPIIGLPMPFLSYGGTNIIVYFMFLGILANIKN